MNNLTPQNTPNNITAPHIPSLVQAPLSIPEKPACGEPANPLTDPPRYKVPKGLAEATFRAHSFMAKLSPVQLTTLFAWLQNEENTIPDVKDKVAAAPPDGFGLPVTETTLYRLRSRINNLSLANYVSDALDSALQVLDSDDVGETTPIHDALEMLLYSRAYKWLQNGVDEKSVDCVVNTLTKLRRLKPSPKSSGHREPSTQPAPSRHRIELSIVPATTASPDPKIVNISATPLPPS